MLRSLPWISALTLLFAATIVASAQSLLPENDGERRVFAAMIEMPRGYVSGVCVMQRSGDEVRASIFNEFGISALDCIYYPARDKVKIISVISLLNRWYVRRTLRHDLRSLFARMRLGETTYRNERRAVDYRFAPLNE